MAHLEQQRQADVLTLEAHMQDMVNSQKQEHEAAISRQLAFIDKLLADKDELSRKCSQLQEAIQVGFSMQTNIHHKYCRTDVFISIYKNSLMVTVVL